MATIKKKMGKRGKTTKKKEMAGAKKNSRKAGSPKKAQARKRVVVTGAAGFVGSHMVEELADAGFKVIATDLPGSDLSVAREAGAEVIEADLTDAASLKRAFGDKVHYVVHVAALYNLRAKRRDLMRVNRDGTRNVAEAALNADVEHFIYFSTGDIYGQVNRPATEDTPANPLNSYAESKLAGERVLRRLHHKSGLPLTSIRPTVVYGPRCRYTASTFFSIPGIVYNIETKLKRDIRELPVFSDGPRVSWVHVRDITGAVRFLLGRTSAIGKAYNVADDNPMTLEELFTLIFEAFGYRWVPTIPYPTQLAAAIARLGMMMPPFMFEFVAKFMKTNWGETQKRLNLSDALVPDFSRDFMSFMLGDRVYDNSRIKELGYKLRYPDSREGMRETFKWYQKNRWLPRADEVWERDNSILTDCPHPTRKEDRRRCSH